LGLLRHFPFFCSSSPANARLAPLLMMEAPWDILQVSGAFEEMRIGTGSFQFCSGSGLSCTFPPIVVCVAFRPFVLSITLFHRRRLALGSQCRGRRSNLDVSERDNDSTRIFRLFRIDPWHTDIIGRSCLSPRNFSWVFGNNFIARFNRIICKQQVCIHGSFSFPESYPFPLVVREDSR